MKNMYYKKEDDISVIMYYKKEDDISVILG